MTSDTIKGGVPDIADTLAQRGSTYGDFREQGRITQNLKRAMQDSPNWQALPGYMKEGLDMVVHKISRMLNGDPFYDDNLHDMVGYTKLMQDRAAQDRDNGIKFVTPGDKLYPVYSQEFSDDPPEPGYVNETGKGPIRKWGYAEQAKQVINYAVRDGHKIDVISYTHPDRTIITVTYTGGK